MGRKLAVGVEMLIGVWSDNKCQIVKIRARTELFKFKCSPFVGVVVGVVGGRESEAAVVASCVNSLRLPKQGFSNH